MGVTRVTRGTLQNCDVGNVSVAKSVHTISDILTPKVKIDPQLLVEGVVPWTSVREKLSLISISVMVIMVAGTVTMLRTLWASRCRTTRSMVTRRSTALTPLVTSYVMLWVIPLPSLFPNGQYPRVVMTLLPCWWTPLIPVTLIHDVFLLGLKSLFMTVSRLLFPSPWHRLRNLSVLIKKRHPLRSLRPCRTGIMLHDSVRTCRVRSRQ